MAGERVTLSEIAKATGYTINTVSRALRDRSDIAPATRKRIQEVAHRMGYVPNMAAASLRLGKSNTIACIVGYVVNPYFGLLFEYVAKAAEAYGWNVMVMSANENEQSELAAIQSAYARGVDGVILVPTQQSNKARELLEQCGLPYVLLSRHFPGFEADCVLCDEEHSGYLAAMHLMEAGHRKLAYVCDGGCVHNIVDRRDGFLRAVREAGIPDADVRLLPSRRSTGEMDAVDQSAELARLCREEGFTGVAAFCDMQARYIIAELRKYRIRVPEELAFVGFDNIDSASPSPLPLCSVGSDYQAMCELAVKMLYSRVQGDNSPVRTEIFPVQMNCRHSCHS